MMHHVHHVVRNVLNSLAGMSGIKWKFFDSDFMQAYSSWVPEEFSIAYLCELKDTVLASSKFLVFQVSLNFRLPTSGLTQ
ncbi:hypothetical protein Y032_0343g3068 [Ancylostoma ceylanicum]|uniref:Uncharacterized protein n=1 Tax=Ancylostoma ceylanicum TaxID=53326 RepID=A0A016RXU7_9BILA|nr:hypothetical protein Y032_0343g3068 [Ancylostoma ceylanicum]